MGNAFDGKLGMAGPSLKFQVKSVPEKNALVQSNEEQLAPDKEPQVAPIKKASQEPGWPQPEQSLHPPGSNPQWLGLVLQGWVLEVGSIGGPSNELGPGATQGDQAGTRMETKLKRGPNPSSRLGQDLWMPSGC